VRASDVIHVPEPQRRQLSRGEPGPLTRVAVHEKTSGWQGCGGLPRNLIHGNVYGTRIVSSGILRGRAHVDDCGDFTARDLRSRLLGTQELSTGERIQQESDDNK